MLLIYVQATEALTAAAIADHILQMYGPSQISVCKHHYHKVYQPVGVFREPVHSAGSAWLLKKQGEGRSEAEQELFSCCC